MFYNVTFWEQRIKQTSKCGRGGFKLLYYVGGIYNTHRSVFFIFDSRFSHWLFFLPFSRSLYQWCCDSCYTFFVFSSESTVLILKRAESPSCPCSDERQHLHFILINRPLWLKPTLTVCICHARKEEWRKWKKMFFLYKIFFFKKNLLFQRCPQTLFFLFGKQLIFIQPLHLFIQLPLVI